MTTTFENAKVGDRVWDFIYGWGEIVELCYTPSIVPYEIIAKFGDCQVYYYKTDGCSQYSGERRTLFWGEIKFEAPKQPPRVKLTPSTLKPCWV
jgi:hypothetical protein